MYHLHSFPDSNGPEDGWLDLHTFQEHLYLFLSFFLLFSPCPACCFRTLYQIFMCVYFLALTHFIILFHRAPHFMKTAAFPQPHAHTLPSLFAVNIWSCQSWVFFMRVLVSPSPYNILRENICFFFPLRQINPFWAGIVARKIAYLEYEFSSLFRKYDIPPYSHLIFKEFVTASACSSWLTVPWD